MYIFNREYLFICLYFSERFDYFCAMKKKKSKVNDSLRIYFNIQSGIWQFSGHMFLSTCACIVCINVNCRMIMFLFFFFTDSLYFFLFFFFFGLFQMQKFLFFIICFLWDTPFSMQTTTDVIKLLWELYFSLGLSRFCRLPASSTYAPIRSLWYMYAKDDFFLSCWRRRIFIKIFFFFFIYIYFSHFYPA